MTTEIAELSLSLARGLSLVVFAYLLLGAVFAIFFLWRGGADRLDPVARGSGLAFRFLILPGVLALWPWLWRRQRKSPEGDPT